MSFPKKKYTRYKRDHASKEWLYDCQIEYEYDFIPKDSKDYKYVQEDLRRDLTHLESPLNQTVTTTPSKKDNETSKIEWYNSPLFIYLIWPLLVGIVIYALTKLF